MIFVEIIEYVHVIKNDGYRRIIVLYTNGTWENIAEIHHNRELFNGRSLVRKTRNEALDSIQEFVSKD
jgi:hypothetical protein